MVSVVAGVCGDWIYSDKMSQYVPGDVLRYFVTIDQKAHRNTMVNTSTLNNGNVELLSKGGK